MEIIDRLYELSDKEYALFSAKLAPTLDKDSFIGVRVPILRELVKEIKNTEEAKEFIKVLPHKYYEENLLHGFLISEIKDYDEAIYEMNRFLPYVDNWAVCDTTKPKAFKKNLDKLIIEINKWINSNETYTIRYGIDQLMSYYLDDKFDKSYLDNVSKIKSDEYYVNMMIAWYFATALAKQWDATIPYIENGIMDKWTHNKTIQKAIESYRVSDEQKEYLRTLRK